MKASYFAEYCRPWKVATLVAGIGLLVVGSFYYEAPDWDIPISFIMAALAYLSAPWSLRVIVELVPRDEDDSDHIVIRAEHESRLFHLVVGFVSYALAAHSDNVQLMRWGKST